MIAQLLKALFEECRAWVEAYFARPAWKYRFPLLMLLCFGLALCFSMISDLRNFSVWFAFVGASALSFCAAVWASSLRADFREGFLPRKRDHLLQVSVLSEVGS